MKAITATTDCGAAPDRALHKGVTEPSAGAGRERVPSWGDQALFSDLLLMPGWAEWAETEIQNLLGLNQLGFDQLT